MDSPTRDPSRHGRPSPSSSRRLPYWRRFRRLFKALAGLGGLAILIGTPLLISGCENPIEAQRLSAKGRMLWENGRYEDAARNFVTLSDLYPGTPLAQESLYWAANLYQHFLDNPSLAARYYQHLIVTYPKGDHFYEAKENLAALYEEKPDSRHRALQIYQQLLLADPYAERKDELLYNIGILNLRLGRMDQARLSFRDLLDQHPKSAYRPRVSYLVGYTYYLEKRFDLAIAFFQKTGNAFPGQPIAGQALFFIADTLEEQGEMRKALKAFKALKGQYHNPDILKKRIKTLQARIRRGVR